MKVPYEYFCKDCGQIRLCFDPDQVGCKFCGSIRIITGEVNELDKDKLKYGFYNEEYIRIKKEKK